MSSTQNITVKNITLTPATLLWNPLHDVWKSLEKSHSILRAKRATFTIGQKWSIWRIIDNLNVRSNSITRQVNFSRTKISGQCQKRKLQMRHFGWFLNNVPLFKISEWEKNRISSSIKPSTLCPNSIWDQNFKRVFGQKILFWHSVCSLLVVKSSYSLTHQLPEYRTEPHRKKCKISYESELQHFKIWPRMTHD